MDWITETVAIGNYLEAQDSNFLSEHGFHSVLSLDGALRNSKAEDLGIGSLISIPLIDGPGNDRRELAKAIATLTNLENRHAPVLVHCHAGRSRSVVVVAGFLAKTGGIEWEQAIAFVATKREINVTPALEELLDRVCTD